MISIALALATALTYGAADFFGGLASRRAPLYAVVAISQTAGVLAVALVLPVLGRPLPAGALPGSILAGLVGGVAIALLYRALAIGRMGVVSPITAVLAAVVPVGVAVARGEHLSAATIAGIALAVVAIALVSASPGAAAPGSLDARLRLGPGIVEAVLAGVGFGVIFVMLAGFDRVAGLAPLVPMRLVSIALIGSIAVARGELRRVPRSALPAIVASGVLDMSANVFFVIASRTGALSVVSVLAALYPAGTVALAALVLHERLSRVQWAGVGCALAGVALVTL